MSVDYNGVMAAYRPIHVIAPTLAVANVLLLAVCRFCLGDLLPPWQFHTIYFAVGTGQLAILTMWLVADPKRLLPLCALYVYLIGFLSAANFAAEKNVDLNATTLFATIVFVTFFLAVLTAVRVSTLTGWFMLPVSPSNATKFNFSLMDMLVATAAVAILVSLWNIFWPRDGHSLSNALTVGTFATGFAGFVLTISQLDGRLVRIITSPRWLALATLLLFSMSPILLGWLERLPIDPGQPIMFCVVNAVVILVNVGCLRSAFPQREISENTQDSVATATAVS